LELDSSLSIGEGHDYDSRSVRLTNLCIENPDIFHNLHPIDGAIEAVDILFHKYDLLFLSTPMWALPESYTGKRIWIENHFGEKAMDRLILTKRKDLNHGHYLIDDTTRNGAGEFKGEHIHFGTEKFPNWDSILKYLIK
jgi:5'-nucleotidase